MLEIPASHGVIMAKDGNTFAKRQRETQKKRKAQEKGSVARSARTNRTARLLPPCPMTIPPANPK